MTGRAGPAGPGDETGSAPASVLAYLGAMTAILAVLTLAGAMLLAQARADTAADLAALAGADALAAGTGEPCAIAAEAASRNEASVVFCVLEGQDVVVRARTTDGRLPAREGTARAGPAPGPEQDGPDTGAPM